MCYNIMDVCLAFCMPEFPPFQLHSPLLAVSFSHKSPPPMRPMTGILLKKGISDTFSRSTLRSMPPSSNQSPVADGVNLFHINR